VTTLDGVLKLETGCAQFTRGRCVPGAAPEKQDTRKVETQTLKPNLETLSRFFFFFVTLKPRVE